MVPPAGTGGDPPLHPGPGVDGVNIGAPRPVQGTGDPGPVGRPAGRAVARPGGEGGQPVVVGPAVDTAVVAVVVEVGAWDGDEHLVQVTCESEDNALRITIEDDGVGLGLARDSDASGQGLALHSTMMAVVGGTLTVESREPAPAKAGAGIDGHGATWIPDLRFAWSGMTGTSSFPRKRESVRTGATPFGKIPDLRFAPSGMTMCRY